MLDAGIVDQDVEPAVTGGDVGHGRERGRAVGDVERHGLDGVPGGGDSPGGLAQRRGVAGVDDDMGTVRGQGLGHGEAEPARGAGHQGHAPVEAEQVGQGRSPSPKTRTGRQGLHPCQERRPALRGRAVHAVVAEPEGPAARVAQGPDAAQDDPPARVADDEPDPPPGRAVGREAADQADVVQAALDRRQALGQLEGGVRHPDPVDPALEDGGHAVPPGRVDEDQPLGPAQMVEMFGNRRLVDAGRVVAQSVLGAEHGVEADPIEIELAHLVARPAEALKGAGVDGVDEALGHRVGQHHQHLHQKRSISRPTSSRNAARVASGATLRW